MPPLKNSRNLTILSITNVVSSIGLILAGIGLFYTAKQVELSRKIARSELMRAYYSSIQQYNDIQILLTTQDKSGQSNIIVPQNDTLWFRVQRYMGLISEIDNWHKDGIMETHQIDNAYSHRIKAIYTHPVIKRELLEKNPKRWTTFQNLVELLQDQPIYMDIR